MTSLRFDLKTLNISLFSSLNGSVFKILWVSKHQNLNFLVWRKCILVFERTKAKTTFYMEIYDTSNPLWTRFFEPKSYKTETTKAN